MSDFTIFQGANYNRDFFSKKINQSLRFVEDNSTYLSFTPTGTTGGRTKFTYSGWVKICEFSTADGFYLITAPYASNLNGSLLYINASNVFRAQLRTYNAGAQGSIDASYTSSMVFRDPSAWYHIVFAFDSTATLNSPDTMRLWVNGVLQTNSSPDYPSASGLQYLGSEFNHDIGRWLGTNHADTNGYMAEVHFIDGTAYGPEYFGVEENGVWVPITPPLTTEQYGSNGFHLDFADSSSIGNDVSGKNNDFTPNNLAASDVVPDSPTNNFCTWNPLEERNQKDIVPPDDFTGTLSEGNLEWDSPTCSTRNHVATSTFWVGSGKWYWEGVMTRDSGGQSRFAMGTKYFPTRYDWFYASTASVGTVYGIKVDLDTNSLQYTTDGITYSNFTADGSNSSSLGDYPLTAMFVGCNSAAVANFGQDSTFAGNKTAGGNTDSNGIGDFYYTPPSGFLALSTANLPEPSPAFTFRSGKKPSDHFTSAIWAGDNTSPRTIPLDFTPDFIWTKSRSNASSHFLYDTVRGLGANKDLSSDKTNAEGQEATDTFGYVDSSGSTGFNVVAGSTNRNYVNETGRTYVAWCWKANGSGVSNTDGDFAVTVSVNTEAGFSIVDLTDPDTGASYEVGHGLNSPPEMFFIKKTNTTSDWTVYHKDVGNDKRLVLNDLAAQSGSSSVYFGSTTPTSDVVTIGSGLSTGDDWIMYCWHSVPGFSKFGSYTGNQNADGPFVYTGFRPAFVIIKIATGDTGQWVMYDTARDTYNDMDLELQAESSNVEETPLGSNPIDFVSNGFKIRSATLRINRSTSTFIYMAFAEDPFNFANAR